MLIHLFDEAILVRSSPSWDNTYTGLYAAHLLQNVHNIKVVVLEASNYIGGRLKQVFSPKIHLSLSFLFFSIDFLRSGSGIVTLMLEANSLRAATPFSVNCSTNSS